MWLGTRTVLCVSGENAGCFPLCALEIEAFVHGCERDICCLLTCLYCVPQWGQRSRKCGYATCGRGVSRTRCTVPRDTRTTSMRWRGPRGISTCWLRGGVWVCGWAHVCVCVRCGRGCGFAKEPREVKEGGGILAAFVHAGVTPQTCAHPPPGCHGRKRFCFCHTRTHTQTHTPSFPWR